VLHPLTSETPQEHQQSCVVQPNSEMEAYPVGSLDPSIPLVVALGVSGAMRDGPELFKDAGLKKQGHLIRSDVAPIDSEQAVKLLRYLQEHDASNLSWAAQDPPTGIRYKFCFRTAERVCSYPFVPVRAGALSMYDLTEQICKSRSCYYLPAVPLFPMASNHHRRPPSFIPLSHR